MKKTILLLAAVFFASVSFAKIWRLNNNPGVTANFTNLNDALASASVVDGDTLHLEHSAVAYDGVTVNKRLVLIGPGYLLDPADPTYGGNSGLQYKKESATIGYTQVMPEGAGSKFMGLTMGASLVIYPGASPMNLTIEKCFFLSSGIYFFENGPNTTTNGLTVRKCFFYQSQALTPNGSNPRLNNLILENCILYRSYVTLDQLTGTGNIIRNNSWYQGNFAGANSIANAYIANNIFETPNNTFINATIKNNLFSSAQPLPGTATGNQVSVDMSTVYTGGTGSLDSRVQLKPGSPATGAGVTIAGYTPDAGAYGSTDPYKLSGIPAVPSIYSLSVPTSIPTGSASMNVTFSSRNNN